MSDRPGRWLLFGLLLVEFSVLSSQLAGRGGEPPLIERATVRALGPLAHAVVTLEGGFSGLLARRQREAWLRRENERLTDRVGELERELLRRQSVELDFQRLAAALRYSRQAARALRVADVVYLDHSSSFRSLVLFAGDGATRGQAVVDPRGVVGRVVVASGDYAKVQLITDPASAVGAMVERTRRQGIARGAGPGAMTLDYVPATADVRVGDRIITAGIDGIYPRGLTLGIVDRVSRGTDLFHRISVHPTVDFGLLDGVYLLPLVEQPLDEVGGDDADP